MTDPAIMTSEGARAAIVDMFRRDLVGPLPPDVAPSDADLQTERLSEPPSSWYLTGFIAPVDESTGATADDPDSQEETETDAGDLVDDDPATAEAADDDSPPEAPATRRRYMPSSIGLTVLVPEDAQAVDVRVTWGDYVTEPPLPASVLASEDDDADTPRVDWVRRPRERTVRLPVPKAGKGAAILVPDSAAEQRPGGALELQAHARPFTLTEPGEPPRTVRALSLFLVNRRKQARRRYADVAYVFQGRLEVTCDAGLVSRRDLSAYRTNDDDLRTADLHYREESEYAVGRNTSGGWEAPDANGVVRRAWTDPLPMAEVERVAPNEAIAASSSGSRRWPRRRPAAAGRSPRRLPTCPGSTKRGSLRNAVSLLACQTGDVRRRSASSPPWTRRSNASPAALTSCATTTRRAPRSGS